MVRDLIRIRAEIDLPRSAVWSHMNVASGGNRVGVNLPAMIPFLSEMSPARRQSEIPLFEFDIALESQLST